MTMSGLKSSGARKFLVVCAMAAAMALGACTIERQAKGFVIDPDFADAIMPGLDNKTSVAIGLGNPSMVGTFNEDTWYYISEISRRRSFFKPQTTSRNIIAVRFDDFGIVEDIRRYSLADAIRVKPRKDKTPTRGKKLGVFEQIFSNIGRFSNAPGGPTQ